MEGGGGGEGKGRGRGKGEGSGRGSSNHQQYVNMHLRGPNCSNLHFNAALQYFGFQALDGHHKKGLKILPPSFLHTHVTKLDQKEGVK